MQTSLDAHHFGTFLDRARHAIDKVGGAQNMARRVSAIIGREVRATVFQNMKTPGQKKPMRSSIYTEEMAKAANLSSEWLKHGTGEPVPAPPTDNAIKLAAAYQAQPAEVKALVDFLLNPAGPKALSVASEAMLAMLLVSIRADVWGGG